jgi:hypothetical protein
MIFSTFVGILANPSESFSVREEGHFFPVWFDKTSLHLVKVVSI